MPDALRPERISCLTGNRLFRLKNPDFRSGTLSLLLMLIVFGISACGSNPPVVVSPPSEPAGYQILGKWYYPVSTADGFRQTGIASWYGDPFHGKKTASGETYDMHARTAAHKTLPIGTFVLVRNLDNHKETTVRINDRGPFVQGRIIDLSYRAAKEIGMIAKGTARVEIVVLDPRDETAGVTTGDPEFYTGDFTVQAGAFSDRTRADAFGEELRKFDDHVTVIPFPSEGKTIYRVRIGRFPSLEKARSLESRLIESGYKQAFAVASEE